MHRSEPWTRGYVVEVDVFGAPDKVKASGFSDYFRIADGRWTKAPRTCGPAAAAAERWHGNVRVIVSCRHARAAAGALLAHLQRELDSL